MSDEYRLLRSSLLKRAKNLEHIYTQLPISYKFAPSWASYFLAALHPSQSTPIPETKEGRGGGNTMKKRYIFRHDISTH